MAVASAMTPPRGAAVMAAAAALAVAALAHGTPGAGADQDSADAAAEMARLYAMALENDEMRSHLPDRLRMQMGKKPFMYEQRLYCWGGCVWDASRGYEGFWDHEAYRRSIGEDRGAVCARAYYDLVSRVGWLRDGAYWGPYMIECSGIHSDIVNRAFAPLVEGISHECEMKIIEGWFVVSGGEFRRHGAPAEADRPFVLERDPHIYPDGSHGPTELQFAYFTDCLEGDSTIRTVAHRRGYPHSSADPDSPYHFPPDYAPTDPLGDWAEAREAREARELGSRLAGLYGAALGSAEVRSHLPREIREAISLDVPERYLVFDAYHAPYDDPSDPFLGSNKYDPIRDGRQDYRALVTGTEPTFCNVRPDLQALCG